MESAVAGNDRRDGAHAVLAPSGDAAVLRAGLLASGVQPVCLRRRPIDLHAAEDISDDGNGVTQKALP